MKTEKTEKWINRWGYWIAPSPVKEGVYKRKEGGYVVRGRIVDPRTGKRKVVNKALPNASAHEAYAWLLGGLDKIKQGTPQAAPVRTRFKDFAKAMLDEKLALRRIKSAKNELEWKSVLANHLNPAFGEMYMDMVREAEIVAWQTRVAAQIAAGKVAPTTANNRLRILGIVVRAARRKLHLPFDAMDNVAPFDESEHEVYTDAQPNALLVGELARFMDAMYETFPQHYAMTYLGFVLGARPSSLRPLRRRGDESDVLWDEGVIRLRRSHTLGQTVMNTTKTGLKQRIAVPPAVLDVLRWHVARLPAGKAQESDLLFPSRRGGFRSTTALMKPFAIVAKAIGLKKDLSPRAMRRTYQDLARAAQVSGLVTRAISGHATVQMQEHYSTVSDAETRDGLARVISLAGFGQLKAETPAAAPAVPSAATAEAKGGAMGGAASGTTKAG